MTNKDWEVNVQELDYKELKKEEKKMKNQFIRVNLPVWRVKLLSNSIKVEYTYDNITIDFYIHSKFVFLNTTKDDHKYYFTISLNKDSNYIYYVRYNDSFDENNNPLRDHVKLNGQELANKITYWKDKAKDGKNITNVI